MQTLAEESLYLLFLFVFYDAGLATIPGHVFLTFLFLPAFRVKAKRHRGRLLSFCARVETNIQEETRPANEGNAN